MKNVYNYGKIVKYGMYNEFYAEYNIYYMKIKCKDFYQNVNSHYLKAVA